VTPSSPRSGGGSGHEPSSRRSRGTAAIDEHVDAADGGPETDRFHPRQSNRFSGRGPIEDVTLHEIEDPHHWHLVTYGLSELHTKESDDMDLSGWGFELTFRVDDNAEEKPMWAVDFLASLAAYVWSSHHPFAEGHNLDLRGPIRLDSDSHLTAAMIVEDPVLATLAGPFGKVQFLEVVGLTAGELELCRAWNTDGVKELLARDDPLFITRLERPAVDDDVRWTDEIVRRTKAEGSSLSELRVATLRLHTRLRRRTVIEMGAGAASALGPALRRELVAQDAVFSVVGDEQDVRFVVGDVAGWSWSGDALEIEVALDAVEDLAALFDGSTGWGRHPGWPALRFHVVK
jgi:hypothetical protein